jgi:uncharacterized membrane protein YfcA
MNQRQLTLIDETQGLPPLLIDGTQGLPPLFPLDIHDVVGLAAVVVSLVLASSSGMGGGGLLIPCYILLMDIPVKNAIPLTSVTVFGGSIANNILNARKRHPDKPNLSCIDWDFILLMEPPTIAGAIIGAVLNDYLSDIPLILMLLLLLSFTAFKSLAKASRMYQKETLELQASHCEKQDLINKATSSYTTKPELSSEISSFGAGKQHRAAFLKLTGLFAVVTAINVLKGGPSEGGGPFGLMKCGEACVRISRCLILLIAGLFVVWSRSNLLTRLRAGGPVLSDIDWDDRNTVTYPALSIVAGLVAGLFGVGGGLVKGPLMLALNLHPAVTSATTACMIFFTSSTSTISYMIFGLVQYDYAVACLFVGFFSTLAGQTLTAIIIRALGHRHSYTAYLIGIVVAISAVAMTVEAILALATPTH